MYAHTCRQRIHTHALVHTHTYALRFLSHALLRVLLGNAPPTLSFGAPTPHPPDPPECLCTTGCWGGRVLQVLVLLLVLFLKLSHLPPPPPHPTPATRQFCREGPSQSPRMLFTKLATSVSLESWRVKKGCCWVWKRFEISILCSHKKQTALYISMQNG